MADPSLPCKRCKRAWSTCDPGDRTCINLAPTQGGNYADRCVECHRLFWGMKGAIICDNCRSDGTRAPEDRAIYLDALITRINEKAVHLRDLVGTGTLVAPLREGFQEIVELTREKDKAP